MPVTVVEQDEGKLLVVNVRGKLSKKDYERFVPQMERLIGLHGRISFLVKFEDFEGFEVGALWEDIKFDAKHFNDVRRVAVVGEERWTKWMTTFCKPFTTGEVRFFPPEKYQQALTWASPRSDG